MVGKVLILVGFGAFAVFETVRFVQSIIKYCKSREKPPNKQME